MQMCKIILFLFLFHYSLSNVYGHNQIISDIHMNHFYNMALQVACASDHQGIKNTVMIMRHENYEHHFHDLCIFLDQLLKESRYIMNAAHDKNLDTIFVDYQDQQLLSSQHLIDMQRYNRNCIKLMMVQVQNSIDNQVLYVALKELFHALHHTKKHIVTFDTKTLLYAWYMYVIMLSLHTILQYAQYHMQKEILDQVEYNRFLYQLSCILQRFKHMIMSDFYE